MSFYLTRQAQDFTVGTPLVLESFFEHSPYGVVFEDDGDTAYFYAVHQENGILDALGIYNVQDVADKNIPNEINIIWNEACTVAALDINGYINALFDFNCHAGYCRNAFPEAYGDWLQDDNRLLSDELLNQYLPDTE